MQLRHVNYYWYLVPFGQTYDISKNKCLYYACHYYCPVYRDTFISSWLEITKKYTYRFQYARKKVVVVVAIACPKNLSRCLSFSLFLGHTTHNLNGIGGTV